MSNDGWGNSSWICPATQWVQSLEGEDTQVNKAFIIRLIINAHRGAIRVYKSEPLISYWGKEGFRGNVWKKHLDNLQKYEESPHEQDGKHFSNSTCKGKEYNVWETDMWSICKTDLWDC